MLRDPNGKTFLVTKVLISFSQISNWFKFITKILFQGAPDVVLDLSHNKEAIQDEVHAKARIILNSLLVYFITHGDTVAD